MQKLEESHLRNERICNNFRLMFIFNLNYHHNFHRKRSCCGCSWRPVPGLVKALVLAHVVGAAGAVHVVPEVVPPHGDQGVVVLQHGQAVLPVEVVGLAWPPVKPGHGLVAVIPGPNAGRTLTMSLLNIRKDTLYVAASTERLTSVVAPSQNCPHSPTSSSSSSFPLSQ